MGGVPWTKEEDQLLRKCIEKYGEGKWHRVPLLAGLNRCRKSCRLRWLNYLRPNIKRGSFEEQEVELIIKLHRLLGNRWSLVASRLPGRTGNDVKNYWNCHLSKKLIAQETDRQQKKTSSHAKNDNVQPSNPTNSKKPVPSLVEDKIFQPLEESSSASMAMLCNINEDHGQSQIFEAEDNGNNNIPCVGDQEDDGNNNDFMGNLATVDLDQFEQITINQFEQEVNSNKWDWDDSILDTDLWSYK